MSYFLSIRPSEMGRRPGRLAVFLHLSRKSLGIFYFFLVNYIYVRLLFPTQLYFLYVRYAQLSSPSSVMQYFSCLSSSSANLFSFFTIYIVTIVCDQLLMIYIYFHFEALDLLLRISLHWRKMFYG